MPAGLGTTLRQDLDVKSVGVGGWAHLAIRLGTVRGLATVLFRLSQLVGARAPLLGLIVKQINHLLTGADLAWQAQVGPGLALYHPTGVVIGPDVVLGPDCALNANVTLGAARERGRMYGDRVDSPRIGAEVIIGAGAVVIGPIEVGSRSTVGANAVVVRDAAEGSVLLGAPARDSRRLERR